MSLAQWFTRLIWESVERRRRVRQGTGLYGKKRRNGLCKSNQKILDYLYSSRDYTEGSTGTRFSLQDGRQGDTMKWLQGHCRRTVRSGESTLLKFSTCFKIRKNLRVTEYLEDPVYRVSQIDLLHYLVRWMREVTDFEEFLEHERKRGEKSWLDFYENFLLQTKGHVRRVNRTLKR